MKASAERHIQQALTHVVLGRPVHFHDNDASKDREAQNTLQQIAYDLGFKEVGFQYEPIAAALAYEATLNKEQLALIVDMGGGTSDFTVIRLGNRDASLSRSKDVLANCGIHIAGTDFDKDLSLNSIMPLLGKGSFMLGSSSEIEVPAMWYHDLTTWHTLNNLYTAETLASIQSIQAVALEKPLIGRLLQVLQSRRGHHILNTVEICKQLLSDRFTVTADLNFIEANLLKEIDRVSFNNAIANHVSCIIETIQQAIAEAGIQATEISAIFYTGGSTKIPLIREQINSLFPDAEIVQGDVFGSVGTGLTLEAKKRYG